LYQCCKRGSFPLIFISDPATRRIFRDDVEEDAQLNVHVGYSGHMDADISHGYLRHIFILPVKNCWHAKEISDFHIYAVLLMDNYFHHLRSDTIQLFFDNKTKVIIFPLHISEIFQLFDFVFFGIFKQAKRQRDKETKRQRDKETKRQRDKETKRQRDKETKRQRGKEGKDKEAFMEVFQTAFHKRSCTAHVSSI
jgi:hypothetical protein